MAGQRSFYKSVLRITEDYFGPAAPRILNRLVMNHFDKPASDLTVNDLSQLAVWMQLALGMVTEDEQLIDEYVRRLNALDSSVGRSSKTAHAMS